MTGMRGEPCPHLYQRVHIQSGSFIWECDLSECVGKPGTWCPIVGDKKYSIVR